MLNRLRKELKASANAERAEISKRFFKTGAGEYGEGDVFLGADVPSLRKIAKKFHNLSIRNIRSLLDSDIHEERLIGLIILSNRFAKADDVMKKEIFNFYMKNTKRINNWDLVDVSAPRIVGEYLADKDRRILYKLANSDSLWEKRIAIISTYSFIRRNQFGDTIAISEILMSDGHDLINKAVGWMLREIGKRDKDLLEKFLKKHCKNMPRTMLRYAIEKFDAKKRAFYMKK